MTDSRPPDARPIAPARRPVWRHPAVLGLAALLLVLLIVQLVASDDSKPQDAAVRPAQSPTVDNVQEQWADFVATPVAPAESQDVIEAPGRTFIAKLNLQPRLLRGQIKGYVVSPADPSILNGTPLQPGDVLLEVDGLTLDAARAASLAQSVGDYQDVFVLFERGNKEQEGMLPLGTR